MISKKHVKDFVREGEIEKIENYDKTIADKTQTWECHHRLELTLDGEFAHTREELKRMGMYYNRPYFELIFLTKAEHSRLHGKTRKGVKFSEERIKNLSEALKGRKLSEETRKKMSEANKRRFSNEEARKKVSETFKGRKFSEEHKKKLSEALSKPKSEFGKKYFGHYGYSQRENKKQYVKEKYWYYKHNKKCSWEVVED